MDRENQQCFWLDRFEDLASSAGLDMQKMAAQGTDEDGRELQAARCAVCCGVDLACQYYLPMARLGDDAPDVQADGEQ